jgi:hypothetical protein
MSSVGSDCRRSRGEGAQEIGEGDQRVQCDHWLADQRHLRTALPRCHPVRQETPCPIGELAAEPVAAIHGPLVARDRQRLTDERMPGVVDGDGTWKLRNM